MSQQTTYEVKIIEAEAPDRETAAENLRSVILDGLGYPSGVIVEVELIAGRPVRDGEPSKERKAP